jgi:hypothetical protein
MPVVASITAKSGFTSKTRSTQEKHPAYHCQSACVLSRTQCLCGFRSLLQGLYGFEVGHIVHHLAAIWQGLLYQGRSQICLTQHLANDTQVKKQKLSRDCFPRNGRTGEILSYFSGKIVEGASCKILMIGLSSFRRKPESSDSDQIKTLLDTGFHRCDDFCKSL